MRSPVQSTTLFLGMLVGLAIKAAASPSPFPASEAAAATEIAPTDTDIEDTSNFMTVDQFERWLATTDAELTFVGGAANPLAPLAARVTYCSTRFQNVCSGPCTVYSGAGGVCLAAPHTNCLAATANVVFCAGRSCGGGCNQLASCGTRLDNGFCYTPGTNSISVPV